MTSLLTLVVSGIVAAVAIVGGLRLWHQRHNETVAQRSERAKQRRQTNFDRLLPVALFQFSPGNRQRNGQFLYVSDGIERLLPVTGQQLMQSPDALLNLLNAEDAQELRWLVGEVPCNPRILWEGRATTVPGQWLQIEAVTDIGADGEPVLNGMITDISTLKNIQYELTASREDVRRLAAHRERKRESDYQRLAREFHDELGQTLNSARMRLQLLGRNAPDVQACAIAEIDKMISDSYDGMKAITADLRPPTLSLGLQAAIEWQIERSLGATDVRATTSWRYAADLLNEDVQTAFFRIAQEALTNAARYSKAKNVHLSLRKEVCSLIFEVADDGVGFNPDCVDSRNHFGLAGMRERAFAIGGTLEVDSSPGEGARIHVRLPLDVAEVERSEKSQVRPTH